jgi:hypothetical protein
MSLNPLVSLSNEPYRKENEMFILRRIEVKFEITLQAGNKYSGTGMVKIKIFI